MVRPPEEMGQGWKIPRVYFVTNDTRVNLKESWFQRHTNRSRGLYRRKGAGNEVEICEANGRVYRTGRHRYQLTVMIET